MKTGNVIKKAFDLYLNNPLIILPFLIVGAVRNTITFTVRLFLKENFSGFQFNGIQTIFLLENLAETLLKSVVAYSLILVFIGILVMILGSFLEAYAIGLSSKMVDNKAKLSDGLSSMIHGPAIIGKTLLLFILFLAGSIVVILPAVILFGALGLLFATIILLVYSSILIAVSFFSNQSIVLDNKGPWEGIVGSYKFIKKNLEGVAILILFVVGLYVAFGVIHSTGTTMASYFLNEINQLIVNGGLHLILYSLVLYPFLVILKTFYFIKNK